MASPTFDGATFDGATFDSAAAEQTLREWERDRDLGCTVLMTHAGETVFEGAYGLADRATGTPVTSATRFALASVTKMFTAAAVVDLVASGALAYDAPVVSVLPQA